MRTGARPLAHRAVCGGLGLAEASVEALHLLGEVQLVLPEQVRLVRLEPQLRAQGLVLGAEGRDGRLRGHAPLLRPGEGLARPEGAVRDLVVPEGGGCGGEETGGVA